MSPIRMRLRVSSQQAKDVRIRSVSPIVDNGQVFVPKNREGELLIEEALAFPNGRHDDCIDVMAMVLDFWRQRLIMAEAPSRVHVAANTIRSQPGTIYRTGTEKRVARRISMRG